ncbi:hypothetical protein EDEG_02631 [Edhazardia aedis USNM 41457]|uniref:inorganic diphosphatase n=1 Tax=Edhazardia aedis (strain USNM 41457) TaxID=1003232 RepID=J9DNM1_EDHAE|nr:hypothetical protein EDEG_02631 [Edhazardia aedis USNM 41457]|eukprot:EJW02987.1 hypothetical protein EDEG_02631 [Edhazardia aedis USNM 41457]
MYSTVEVGSKYSKNYEVYIKKDNECIISPFHDIPVKITQGNQYTFVTEIPRFENAKFEMNKKKAMNPITQDTKKDLPRFVSNLFPYTGYIWNYGMIPQTWENPKITDVHTNCNGDNDPVDAIEIGSKKRNIGEVFQIKVIGCLAMIDDNECDWKVLCISNDDEMYSKLNTIEDVNEHMPGLLDATVSWFRDYKLADGKPKNEFAFNASFLDAEFAMGVIDECHIQWKRLFDYGYPGISQVTGVNGESEHFVDNFKIPGNALKEKDSPKPSKIEGYFFPDTTKKSK